MNTALISHSAQPPDWAALPAIPINHLYWSPKVDISAEAKICYDDVALYVALSAYERHIRAEHTTPTGIPCEDSCLEFFFSPDPQDPRYLNVEFNPNCCLFLGIGTSAQDRVRLFPDQKVLFDPRAQIAEDLWRITYQIPHSFVRQYFPNFSPVSGQTMRANFYKCGDLTPQAHYLSWNPLTSCSPCFHKPCDFGLLIFG